jgi:hypothetical protein
MKSSSQYATKNWIHCQIDRQLAIERAAKECGATASVALLHSLDNPVQPFFASERLSLTVAHVGYFYLPFPFVQYIY